jgi:DNA-binding winged helix-turn-helix (wHTH) protein
MAGPPRIFYEFDSFRIDPEERVLSQSGTPIPLNPKAFEILVVLVQHSERVVLKDDLMKQLWPDSFVEEANLTQNIFMLRKALGESGRSHRYIVTIPGRGYRFATRVTEVSESETDQHAAISSQPTHVQPIPEANVQPALGQSTFSRRRLALGGALVVFLLMFGGLL